VNESVLRGLLDTNAFCGFGTKALALATNRAQTIATNVFILVWLWVAVGLKVSARQGAGRVVSAVLVMCGMARLEVVNEKDRRVEDFAKTSIRMLSEQWSFGSPSHL